MYPKLTIQVYFSYRPDLVLTNIFVHVFQLALGLFLILTEKKVEKSSK